MSKDLERGGGKGGGEHFPAGGGRIHRAGAALKCDEFAGRCCLTGRNGNLHVPSS